MPERLAASGFFNICGMEDTCATQNGIYASRSLPVPCQISADRTLPTSADLTSLRHLRSRPDLEDCAPDRFRPRSVTQTQKQKQGPPLPFQPTFYTLTHAPALPAAPVPLPSPQDPPFRKRTFGDTRPHERLPRPAR